MDEEIRKMIRSIESADTTSLYTLHEMLKRAGLYKIERAVVIQLLPATWIKNIKDVPEIGPFRHATLRNGELLVDYQDPELPILLKNQEPGDLVTIAELDSRGYWYLTDHFPDQDLFEKHAETPFQEIIIAPIL